VVGDVREYHSLETRNVLDGLDDKLTPAACQLVGRLRPRIAEWLSEVQKIPVAVLIWVPGKRAVIQWRLYEWACDQS